jgi:hypothetical protein
MLRAWPGQAAFRDFALEAGRPGVCDDNEGAVEVLRSRFAGMTLDLIVAVGAPASRFYAEHREKLFPSVPRLMLGMDERIAPISYDCQIIPFAWIKYKRAVGTKCYIKCKPQIGENPMSYTLIMLLITLALFFGVLLLLEVGKRVGARRLARDPGGDAARYQCN